MIDLTHGQILHTYEFRSNSQFFLYNLLDLLIYCDINKIEYFTRLQNTKNHLNYLKLGNKCLNFNKNSQSITNTNDYKFFSVDPKN